MSSGVTRLIICGAAGRMGARLCALALEDPALALVGALEAPGSGAVGRRAAPAGAAAEPPEITDSEGVFAPRSADAVIDFSSDAGALRAAHLAERIGAALLVGTTAVAAPTLQRLADTAKKIPVLIAPNTSLGVAALAALVARAAQLLGPQYACSIVEAHHSAKKDAPSGTALRLADAARRAGAQVRADQVLALRGGDVVGEHTVRFAGPGEYLELTHRATSRDLFARGALHAAKWLRARSPGRYTIEDVLGLGA